MVGKVKTKDGRKSKNKGCFSSICTLESGSLITGGPGSPVRPGGSGDVLYMQVGVWITRKCCWCLDRVGFWITLIQKPTHNSSDAETNVIQTPTTLTSDPDSNVHIQDIAPIATTARTIREARTANNE
ncbi:hypothetical protein CDAR_192411 [Caerostris darwini]|uniref:Uncharacterized protein n=1 Tax=Caerostris darwini TaxID=1538125 RepID=A0AAV4R5V9_9ARAC|nr:hypothetical protein CDAR_192411 [Caerostris darwini]